MGSVSEAQLEVLTRLARTIAASGSDAPLPLRICEACLSILGVDGGSLTFAYGAPERVTLCATNRRAKALEDLQEVIGEGPSYAAYDERTIMTFLVDGAGATDERWPLFSAGVKEAFDGCFIYAVPIMPGPQTMGVATFHQQRPAPLLVDDATGQLLINAVGVALVRDVDVFDDDRFLRADSWNSRARVNQATGMVMAQLRVSPDDALAVLRAHAYAHGRALSEVSDDIIGGGLDFRTSDQAPGSERS